MNSLSPNTRNILSSLRLIIAESLSKNSQLTKTCLYWAAILSTDRAWSKNTKKRKYWLNVAILATIFGWNWGESAVETQDVTWRAIYNNVHLIWCWLTNHNAPVAQLQYQWIDFTNSSVLVAVHSFSILIILKKESH